MHHRWHWLPISLVAAGVLAMWVAAAVNYAALGWWQVLVYLGGLVALAGSLLFRRELSTAEQEVEKLRHELRDEDSRLEEERKNFSKLQQEVERQFEEQGRKLDKREAELASRLVAYHEWPSKSHTRHPSARSINIGRLIALFSRVEEETPPARERRARSYWD